MTTATYRGVVRGQTIELDSVPESLEGQVVTVHVQPVPGALPGSGIRSSSGAWAEAGPEFDEWLAQIQAARHAGRSLTQQ